MEDYRNRTERTDRLRSYFTKRRRIEDVVDDYGINDNNNKTNTDHLNDCPAICHCDIEDRGDPTAPFDVTAFIQYLADIDNYNIRTHYYGDDCPDGHYND